MNDLDRTKKIIYIVAGIIAFLLVGIFVYRFFAPTATPVKKPTPGITGRLPGFPGGEGGPGPGGGIGTTTPPIIIGAPEKKLLQLTDFSVVSPGINKAGDRVLYYKKDGGDLFASDFVGERQEKISNITVLGLREAFWSRVGDRAAVFYLDQETMRGFLHIGTTSSVVLPQNIKSFSWSPDGRSLAYAVEKSSEANLVTADASGKNPRTIFTTPVRDVSITWVSSDKIAFETAPSGLAEGYIFLFSRASGSFTRVAGPLFGLTSLWSPDGTRVLISNTNINGKDLQLEVRDSTGANLFTTTVRSLPEKCAWKDANQLYCAIPRQIGQNTTWPDQYLRGEIHTSDTIELLQLDKKTISPVLNEGDFDMSDIVLDPKGDYLFFINRVDGTLWRLKLK